MSDRDPAHDPLDKAYSQAEAMLDDEAARAARRERVLGAVAAGAQAPAPAAGRRRRSWAPGGWLAAASIAGLAVLFAVRVDQPSVTPQEPSTTPPPPAAAAPEIATAPAPEAVERAREVVPRAATPAPTAPPAPKAAPAAPASARRAEIGSSGETAVAAAPRSARASLDSAPAAAAPPARPDQVEQVVVTGSQASPAAAPTAAAEATPVPPAVLAARLRAAAGAGRIAELRALLRRRGEINAADEHGETALMKAVQANQPAAAAILRRHGADLDQKNRAGVSARDMAGSMDDPELNRALGLAR